MADSRFRAQVFAANAGASALRSERFAGANGSALTPGQFADLDNDGDQDLVVVNEDDGQHVPTQLFRNNGDGTLSDVSDQAGLNVPGMIRASLATADFDQDGLLDLYFTNWTAEVGGGAPFFPEGSNQLFRNRGDLRFEDVTQQVGLGGLRRDSFSAIFTDFTGDGYPDLHVAVDHTSDEFYRNVAGQFVRETELVGATHRGNDMGVTADDFDNDGPGESSHHHPPGRRRSRRRRGCRRHRPTDVQSRRRHLLNRLA